MRSVRLKALRCSSCIVARLREGYPHNLRLLFDVAPFVERRKLIGCVHRRMRCLIFHLGGRWWTTIPSGLLATGGFIRERGKEGKRQKGKDDDCESLDIDTAIRTAIRTAMSIIQRYTLCRVARASGRPVLITIHDPSSCETRFPIPFAFRFDYSPHPLFCT